jgi:hypothetical protein
MFPIRFVPNRRGFNASGGQLHKRLQLCDSRFRKTIARADAVLGQTNWHIFVSGAIGS